ncbi:MAG: ABC-type multidrug transport system, permease component [uncultured Thiotrichaceae bacterium]|uniref:Transport permease protein n=1 Tax=uncultured Thiotrichaceae bacterium TaxID=298394 RepID=A0A6S6UFD7_9GAMM|nr:MAG: ABC-type multidrug transport system, permease component [uncultured Thiotrichaceae bacterium]
MINFQAIKVIYHHEMMRAWNTLFQTIASPVLSTSLYFVVFGSAIGSRIEDIGGVSYGAFIVPGLMMLSLLTQSVANASFGIFFPKFSGTVYEIMSAPISSLEILIGFVGAAASKSLIIGIIILITANFFVDIHIMHPFWMATFLILTCISFSLLGFIIGLWATNFEKLQVVPLLVITPLVFLGGTFYSIDMLPPFWQNVSLFNPVLYLVSGFRWSFFEVSDVNVYVSLAMILVFLSVCLGIVWWMFKTGYRLKQ